MKEYDRKSVKLYSLSTESLDGEVWKPLANYRGYSVSSLGRVKSDARKMSNGTGTHISKDKILKPNVLRKEYLQVDLHIDGKRHPRQVHRLVAEAFISNDEHYPQVNHKNGIKNNNRVENLEWCNNSMNVRHAYANGLMRRSEASGREKKKVVLTDKNGESVVFGSYAELKNHLGYRGSISTLIKRGGVMGRKFKGYKVSCYES